MSSELITVTVEPGNIIIVLKAIVKLAVEHRWRLILFNIAYQVKSSYFELMKNNLFYLSFKVLWLS